MADGIAPAGQQTPETALVEAVSAFEALMVQSLITSGMAQSAILRSLPGQDVGQAIAKMRREEEERIQELEREREEDEREAERA